MNIDERLESIFKNHDIFNERKLKNERVKNTLKKLFNSIPSGTNIAFRGGGEHTKELIKYIPDNLNIVCIIDTNSAGCSLDDYKIINIDEIDDFNIDVFVISSYKYRNEMIAELQNQNKDIIDIYDYLSMNGIILDRYFYKYDDRFIDYEIIVELKSKFHLENEKSLKGLYLEEIIINCITIRDFVSAIHYINIYIENGFSKIEEYKVILAEINNFLDDIKKAFSNRKHKDIIMFWLDELSYQEVNEMPYLSNMIDNSLFFTNAYTTTVSTKAVIKSIFQQAMNIDDFAMQNEKLNYDNSVLLNVIKEKGYQFKFISSIFTGAELFEEDLRGDQNELNRTSNSCKRFWKCIKLLLETNEPVFAVVHLLAETHVPFYSPDLELEQLDYKIRIDNYLVADLSKYQVQINISRNYIDKQLKFYSELLSNNCTKIYMSDHGKRADISKVMTEMKVHVLLMVVDENISYRKVNNIFSIINYLDLIKYIMNPSDDLYSKMFQNRYAFYQELDTYNMSRIQTVITSAVIYASAYALRGIITENDKYIITGYGNEFYYILPDEDNNLVEDSKYIERINELRELAGNNFLDIYKYEKFRGSRILYEHFKLKPIGKQKE